MSERTGERGAEGRRVARQRGEYAGGYVAGRMSRFALAILGAIAGSEYNPCSQFNLPRIPIDEGDLATGAVIALVLVLIGTLVAAIIGGEVGERYHRKVDRAGYEATAGPADRERLAGERRYEGERGRYRTA